MLSLILLCDRVIAPTEQAGGRRRERVVRSLASLVAGVAEGLIADGTIVDLAGGELAEVAEEAGCGLVEGGNPLEGIATALDRARYPDVFLLVAGFAVAPGFVEEAHEACAFAALAPSPRLMRAEPDRLLTRLAPRLSTPVGLLARKEALAQAPVTDLRQWGRRLGARDLQSKGRRIP